MVPVGAHTLPVIVALVPIRVAPAPATVTLDGDVPNVPLTVRLPPSIAAGPPKPLHAPAGERVAAPLPSFSSDPLPEMAPDNV